MKLSLWFAIFSLVFSLFSLWYSFAHAECLQWGHDLQGNKSCMVDDAVNHHPIFPDDPLTGDGITFSTGTPPIHNLCAYPKEAADRLGVPTCNIEEKK